MATVLVIVVAFGFAAPVAVAQTADYPTAPETLPAPVPNPTGDEIVLIIQGNNAANAASQAAADAAKAAAAGDGPAAQAAAAKAQAAADKAAAILKAGKTAQYPASTIARLEASANAAAASAAAAAASAKNISVPSVAVPVPNLAFTGSSASLPAALGAALIGAGGLTVLFARKRELTHN